MLDIPSHWLDELTPIFKRWAPEFEVWAYGSRVKGLSHAGSDLDLVLIHPDPTIHCRRTPDIKSELSESNIPIVVDVLDWASLPNEFKKQIETDKVRLL